MRRRTCLSNTKSPLGWRLQETKTCEESKSSQLSASVLRSWCRHTQGAAGGFSQPASRALLRSAQSRTDEQGAHIRADTRTQVQACEWVTGRPGQEGRDEGGLRVVFRLGWQGLSPLLRAGGWIFRHFLALLALFLASSFHGPFFWLSHSWFVMSCECVSWWGLGVRGYTQADKLSRKCFHIVVQPGLHNFSPNLVSFQFEINHKWKFKLGDLESNIWLSSLLWRIGKISHMRSKCGPRRVLL